MATISIKNLLSDVITSTNEFSKELAFFVRSYIILRLEALKLKFAMRLSDIKQMAKNRRFHVVLLEVGKDKRGNVIRRLRSIDNDAFKMCKRRGWLPKTMSYLQMESMAFYSTSIKLNNSFSREERTKAMKKYIKYQKVINHIKL